MENIQLSSLILAVCIAALAGIVGSFALMKRMSLAGDVISHFALPGIGIALLLNANPLIGAAISLAIGVIAIWRIEKNSALATDAVIGVAFTASVAWGVLLTPSEDLLETLFGSFPSHYGPYFWIAIIATLLIGLLTYSLRNKLVISIFSPELAQSAGVKVSKINLIYFLIFGATILLGLQFLGTILVGALLIAPAAASRQLTSSLSSSLFISSLFGILSVVIGFLVSTRFDLAFGPTVVAASAAIFLVTLIKK